ncbi:MAG: polymer-forming cytoskeletal protein [Bacteroidota bacterium]
MFTTHKSKASEAMNHNNNSSNIIGKDTHLEGNLKTSGNLRVEGKVVGGITSKAKVVLGTTAFVQGTITAQHAEVAGSVEGTLEITGLLILKATAVVEGDIVTPKLVFEEGAKFNGKCKMEVHTTQNVLAAAQENHGSFFKGKTESEKPLLKTKAAAQ